MKLTVQDIVSRPERMVSALCLVAIAVALALTQSCSTTKSLAEGESRLAKNEIKVENDKRFKTGEIEPYIKQKPNSSFIFGWNPFLCVYNWSGHSNSFFARISRKLGTAPVVFDSTQISPSVDNIIRHLEYLGYYGSTVEASVKTNRKVSKVKYNVTLGKQYTINGIRYVLPENGVLDEDFCADTNKVLVKKGQYLSESLLEEESRRSSTYFRKHGYYSLTKNNYFFSADTLTTPGEAFLEYRINEYTRNETTKDAVPFRKFYFNEIGINYPDNLKIREKVLRDLNLIHPGDMYDETVVNRTYSRYSALNILSSVNVAVKQSDTASVNADISLSASKIQGFKLNIEASSNSSGLLGISPGLSFYHKNIFHGGEVLNLNFTGNFQFKPNSSTSSTELGVSAGIKFPKFIFVPVQRFKKAVPSTEIKASYNYQNRPEYTRNIISYSFGYSGSYKKLHFQFNPTQLNVVRIYDMNQDFLETISSNIFLTSSYYDHFDFGAGGTIYYTTCTDVNPKRSYHYFKFQFNEAGNFLSLFNPLLPKNSATGKHSIWSTPFSQYVRGEFTAGKTWVFGKNDRQAIATRFLAGAGLAYANSSALPYEQQFYSGGANSLRGWQARNVGPGTSPRDTVFSIPSQTGDMKFEVNAEYRFGMFWKINGAVFVDAGNVWNFKNKNTDAEDIINMNNFLEGIAANWGVGLRLDLNFILLRFDMGMVFRDPSRESGHRWVGPSGWLKRYGYAVHFGVGYPF